MGFNRIPETALWGAVGGPFTVVTINFATSLPTFNTTIPFPGPPGEQLLYLREGSAPGGRLLLSAGGVEIPLSPGGRISARFSTLNVRRGSYAATNGKALLLVLNNGADYVEAPDTPPLFAPIDLIGQASTTNYQTNFPVGAAPTISQVANGWAHPLQGFSRLRFYLNDATNLNVAVTYLVTPWILLNSGVGRPYFWQLPNSAFTLGPSGTQDALVTNYCQVLDVASLVEPIQSLGANSGGPDSSLTTAYLTYVIDWVSGGAAPATVGVAVEGIQ